MHTTTPGLGAGLALLLVIAVGGCATAPPRPAMVPFDETGSYGYAEERLGPGRYEVRYVTPRLGISVADAERSAEVESARQRAFDLALWRAAVLALEDGFPAFTVAQDNRDVAVTVRTEPALSPFWPYPYHGFHRFGRYHPGFDPYYPYYPYGPYGAYDGYRSRASVQVTATLDVEMLEAPTERSYDAEATAVRIEQSYAEATYPGASD